MRKHRTISLKKPHRGTADECGPWRKKPGDVHSVAMKGNEGKGTYICRFGKRNRNSGTHRERCPKGNQRFFGGMELGGALGMGGGNGHMLHRMERKGNRGEEVRDVRFRVVSALEQALRVF